ncbi:MAG: DUF3352 domain-containing protein [Synechococcus sp.]
MKARPFLTALAGVLLSLVLLTSGLLWAMNQRSPLRLVDQPLELPRAARFVPRDAALSLHWLLDPSRLPAYVQAVAPASDRRLARDEAQRWRDGVFALAGLDFDTELASWLGPQLSLTLLNTADQPGWVLALTSRDTDGARRFVQRFWQTRSLAGADMQISSYRGMGLISARGVLTGRQSQSMATALIDDDLLLLASGRGVLEQALDVSQITNQHQLGDDGLQAQLKQLGRGVAVLTASPQAMHQWLALPSDLTDDPALEGLMVALRPEGTSLAVDGALRYRDRLQVASWPRLDDLSASAGGAATWMAQLQNPQRLLDPTERHPLARWLAPALRAHLAGGDTPQLLADGDDGPLLWLQQAKGWVLASRRNQPALESVTAELERQGLSRSDLSVDGETWQVWTRLVRQRGRSEGLEAQLALARAQGTDRNWWGETLAALGQRRDTRALKPLLDGWQTLADQPQVDPAQGLLLSAEPARDVLSQWRPWQLLQVLVGNPLQTHVDGMALVVDRDRLEDQQTVLPFHGRLDLG